MPNRIILAGISAALLTTAPVAAQEAADVLRESLYGGTIASGIEQLQSAVDAGDASALRVTGMLKFVSGIELFSQALYRHGLVGPDTGPMGPVLTTPIPVNENPEPFDYEGVRAVLEDFVATLDEASDLLEASAEVADEDVYLIDPLLFRIDIDGDGIGSDYESIANIFSIQGGMTQVPMEPIPTEPSEPQVYDKLSSEIPAGPATDVAEQPAGSESTMGFDRSDAVWLAGYSQILASQADFFLAHDFSLFVNVFFHQIFPAAGFPMQDADSSTTMFMDPDTDQAIVDAVAAIHTLNWPVIDKERLAGVLERAKRVTALSRQNWELILAETDDNRELVPSPSQTSLVPDEAVTQEIVDAWMTTLDIVDQILDGELLLPHWRLSGGFDLNAYFTQAERTDLVLLFTGYDALPYMKDGIVADLETFAEVNAVFNGNLLAYAFWFN